MAGRVYVVFNESLRSLKVGITGSSDGLRLGQHLREGWTALYERVLPTVGDARGVERSVLHELRVERVLPPHLTHCDLNTFLMDLLGAQSRAAQVPFVPGGSAQQAATTNSVNVRKSTVFRI